MLALTVLTAACSDDPAGPDEPTGDAFGLVLSSVDRTLTVFSVDAPAETFAIGLAPDGSPVTLAVRGTIAAVPLGSVPAVAIADLRARSVARTVPLPAGSGATGIAFLNDSIALVANTNRNTVTPVNVLRGTTAAEIAVGTFPQAAVAVRDTVFVLNANLGPDFSPAGPATVSVLTGEPVRVVATITLSGFNAGAGVATDDGRLLVVNSGSFGQANGSVSVIQRGTLSETQRIDGFGDFPGSIGVGPTGVIHVGSFSYGVAVWNPATSTFTRAPSSAVEPGGIASTAGLAFDDDGMLYTLQPECRAPGRTFRLLPSFAVDIEILTGICPIAITFARVP